MATIPTIHLNGTGRKALLAEYSAAREAVEKAFDALAATTCNGRDFYPQGPEAYERARYERTEAFAHLEAVSNYLDAVLMGICDQL